MAIERIPLNEAARHDRRPTASRGSPTPAIESGEEDLDRSLRPPTLADFVNQRQVTGQLEVFIEAARRRGEPLDHVLLAGPPGLGKTSLAHIIAAELEVPLVQTAGPALERKADVASFLTTLEPGSVFFVDEIHRLNRAIEETLYPAMEDRKLPVVLGQGAGARTVTLDLPAFTLVGATTRAGLLTHAAPRPLRRLATASSTTSPATWRRSSSARRGSSGSRSSPPARRRSRPARAARRASPTGCSSGSGTSPRSTARA